MRKRGGRLAILTFACALALPANAADVMSLPGLQVPPKIEPRAKKKPKIRKKRPKRRKKEIAPTPLLKPRTETPTLNTEPGHYAGRYFVFDTLPDWKGPLAIESGVKYFPPEGEASLSIRFIPKNHRLHRKPGEYRRWLRERGEIDNAGVLDTIKIGKRFGSRSRFTTHVYGGEFLFGKRRSKRYNEIIIVPVAGGTFLIHYDARYDEFDKFLPGYLVFLKSLTLPPAPRYEAEKYYLKRQHMVRPLIEDRISKDASRHRNLNRWYGNPYQFVSQLGLAFGAKVSGNSLGSGRVIILGGLAVINEILSLGGTLVNTSYSEASATGLDLVVRTNLMKQKPITPYLLFTGGVEQFKLNGKSSTGTVASIGAGAALRWRPALDATAELRFRNSARDGSGTVNSPQFLLGINLHFGK